VQSALARAVELDPVIFPEGEPGKRPAPKHLRVAPTVSKRVLRQRRRARFAIAGVAAISALSMFLLVTFHVFAVQSSFQLDKLEKERTAAQRQNEMLRNLVATRSSATTIFREATALGYVMGNPIQLTVTASGETVQSPAVTSDTMPTTPYTAIGPQP
jgi:hypothetical protein